jgi:hypothetical protein
MKGVPININGDVLCKIKGAVSGDYACSKYVPFPEPDTGSLLKYKCLDCEFFIKNEKTSEEFSKMGFCQLFTVRQYNGELKNACSKFSRLSERVS